MKIADMAHQGLCHGHDVRFDRSPVPTLPRITPDYRLQPVRLFRPIDTMIPHTVAAPSVPSLGYGTTTPHSLTTRCLLCDSPPFPQLSRVGPSSLYSSESRCVISRLIKIIKNFSFARNSTQYQDDITETELRKNVKYGWNDSDSYWLW